MSATAPDAGGSRAGVGPHAAGWGMIYRAVPADDLAPAVHERRVRRSAGR